jgi:hypothetical protein
LGTCLHVKHLHLEPPAKKKGERSKAKGATKDLDATRGANKIQQGGRPKRWAKKSPSQTLAKFNKQPHRNQMGSKMIKGGEDMDRANDMGVIGQRREETWKENP